MGALGLASKRGRKVAAKAVSNVPSVQVAKKVTKAKKKAVKGVAEKRPKMLAKAVEKAGMTKKKTLGA